MAKKGLVFITKSTFSAASTVSVNNCFSATYTHYMIRKNLSGTVLDSNLDFRLRVSAVDDSGANYRRQILTASSTTVSGSRTTGSTSWINIATSETTQAGFSDWWVSNPFDAARTTLWADMGYSTATNITLDTRVFAHDLATSYDGFTIINGSGTITGSISVFGLVTS